MKKYIFSLLVLIASGHIFVSPGNAQQRTPVSSVISNAGQNIVFPVVVNVPSTSVTPSLNNQQIPAYGWVLTFYTPPGISAVSMQLESAPAGVNTTTPGTFVPFAGTIDAAFCANPCAVTGYAEIHGKGAYPWVRAHLLSATGSGTITGTLNGYPENTAPVNVTITGGGGCAGTIGTPCQVQEVGNATVLTGQQTVTASAVALATHGARNICVKALDLNAANVYIGPTGITTSTGMELGPGESYCGPVSNSNLIFVRAAAAVGDGVSWIATN